MFVCVYFFQFGNPILSLSSSSLSINDNNFFQNRSLSSLLLLLMWIFVVVWKATEQWKKDTFVIGNNFHFVVFFQFALCFFIRCCCRSFCLYFRLIIITIIIIFQNKKIQLSRFSFDSFNVLHFSYLQKLLFVVIVK